MSDPDLSARNKATVEKMWKALSDFDFETLKSCHHKRGEGVEHTADQGACDRRSCDEIQLNSLHEYGVLTVLSIKQWTLSEIRQWNIWKDPQPHFARCFISGAFIHTCSRSHTAGRYLNLLLELLPTQGPRSSEDSPRYSKCRCDR